MREILFRGKRRDNGEWEFGNLIISPYVKNCVMIERLERKNGYYGTNAVDPESVGQYVGLKDKNGKRIFEGDIVRYTYEPWKGFWNANQLSVIRWDEAGYKLDGIFGTNKYACMSGFLCTIPFNQEETYIPEFEVVGNIHDNPELLRTNGR